MTDNIFEATIGKFKLIVNYDQSPTNPRYDDWQTNLGKLCFRNNKHISRNELNVPWQGEPNEFIKDLKKRYHVFFLDAYIHSGMTISFHGQGTQCRFDTAQYV